MNEKTFQMRLKIVKRGMITYGSYFTSWVERNLCQSDRVKSMYVKECKIYFKAIVSIWAYKRGRISFLFETILGFTPDSAYKYNPSALLAYYECKWGKMYFLGLYLVTMEIFVEQRSRSAPPSMVYTTFYGNCRNSRALIS